MAQIWYIKPDYERFLDMENFEGDVEPGTTTKEKAKRPRESVGTGGGGGGGSAAKPAAPSSTAREKDDADGPKKYKRAFAWFVKDKRAVAEKKVKDVEVDMVLLMSVRERLMNWSDSLTA